MIELEKRGDVFVLRMVAGENRFNAQFITRFNQVLDEVENSRGPAALVTTGEGKFYSNGLDLEWMNTQSSEVFVQHVVNVNTLLVRILTLPMMTVAAINGHVFAGGAMLALAHDFRIMRSDRGYFCLPEIDIGLPFSEPMAEIILAKLPKVTAHEAMCTAKRYPASEAVERQVVHQAAAEADVLPKAIEFAQSQANKDRNILSSIKRQIYKHVTAVLSVDVPRDVRSKK
jgi:enoyl-CoA hydratase/carnithine racemase